jgi:hypothetical protein
MAPINFHAQHNATLSWKTVQPLFFTSLFFCSFTVSAANIWSYHQESDRLNNQTYSFAESPMPSHQLYDDIRLEIICKDNTLQVIVNADSLIASQDSLFNLEYQIDKNPPIVLPMRTFKDSKRRGHTEKQAKHFIDDLLTGKTIFIRVNTLIRKVLSAELPLDNAAAPINQVMADCGPGSTDNAADITAYTLNEFEKEFNKLPSDQQQQVLNKLKKFIMETQKAHSTEK